MEPVVLTTDRLVLRMPTLADAEAIEHAAQDPEIPRYTTLPSPYTRSDAETFLALVPRWWSAGNSATWSIRLDDRLIGVIGLDAITENVGGDHAELGYWMAAGVRGRGYLIEAADAVIEWGFRERGLARIQWRAVVGNVPSARAARSLGFRFEGTQRLALTSPRGRSDGWVAGILATDDRTPVVWPVIDHA